MIKYCLVVVMSALSCAYGAIVAVPKTSDEYMGIKSLDEGRAAYVATDDGNATLYIGSKGSKAMRVTDPVALRGTRSITLEEGQYAVAADPNWVNDVQKNTFRTTKRGALITVSVPNTYELISIACNFSSEGGEMNPDPANMFHHYDGNTCVFECDLGGCSAVTVRGFSVKVKAYGDGEGETDLTSTTFRLKDTFGWFDFANLRDQCFHHHDGNLGQDWSAYKAVSTVKLAGNRIEYDDKRRYSTRISNTNLVFDAGGYEAITLSFRGASMSGGGLEITEFGITNGTAYIVYSHDIDGFEPSMLGVKYTDNLNEAWIHLNASEFTHSGNRITIHNVTGMQGFWRLFYGDAVSNVLKVTLRGTVVVQDSFCIYGSGQNDSGTLYRIEVKDGAITATPVPEQ